MFPLFLWGLEYLGLEGFTGEVSTRLQRQTWSSSPLINTGSGRITWLAEDPFPHLWYGDRNSAYLLGHYEVVATKYWINLSDGQ